MSSIVFVDSRVQDTGSLLAGLAADVRVVVLDPAQDGVTRIAAALAGVTDLDSIQIVSHGASGALYLGSSVLNGENLDEYQNQLARLGTALSADGDILLYGCDVGAGAAGETFIDRLALYTGADVAASDDATGSSLLGGDWVLEASTGTIESGFAISASAQQGYAYTLDTITGTSGNDTDLTGTQAADYMYGLAGADNLSGFAGNDTLNGGTGIDTLSGGQGNDTYIVNHPSDLVIEESGQGSGDDLVKTSVSDTLTANVERMTLTGSANISATGNFLGNILTGNGGNNTLSGGAGDDSLVGGGGDDSLLGGDGKDTLSGGAGSDTLDGGLDADSMRGGDGSDLYYVDDQGDLVVETTNGPGALAGGPAAADDFTDAVIAFIDYSLEGELFVENLTLVNPAADGTGNELNNIITGNELANTLDGLAGVDTLIGALGNDVFVVDNALDVVTELPSEGTDEIQTTVSITALADNVEKLRLQGSGNLDATGNTLANTIYATSGNNVIDGSTGTDTLSYEAGATSGVTVSLAAAGAQATGGSGSDTLSSIERLTGSSYADTFTGGTGNNVLKGMGGNDTLSGGNGNDTLNGGAGNDSLTGGAGDDVFEFANALSANIDTIADFLPADDLVRLDNDIFTAFATVNVAPGATAFYAAAGATTAQDADDRIIYNTSNGNLFYDADGAGGAAATRFAQLIGAPALAEIDFFVIQ